MPLVASIGYDLAIHMILSVRSERLKTIAYKLQLKINMTLYNPIQGVPVLARDPIEGVPDRLRIPFKVFQFTPGIPLKVFPID